jgi:GT2 family glycosyltransferase
MPEYVNPNTHSVHLVGKDGKVIKLRSGQRVVLDDYFEKYCTRGFIKRVESDKRSHKLQEKQIKRAQMRSQSPQLIRRSEKRNQYKKTKSVKSHATINRARKIVDKQRSTTSSATSAPRGTGRKLVVGRQLSADGVMILKQALESDCFPISNDIGVGILCYNRRDSLARLIDSINNNTDLRRTTVFISDDNSDDPQMLMYLDQLVKYPHFVVIRNHETLGVAGNTNRLLRCLKRFKYGILLNDDVEILKYGWEHFYVEAMRRTGMHHFLYLQEGVYGAKSGAIFRKDQIDLRVVQEKPHGAVLAFSNRMLEKCGYFNESYGRYGMEHVDWSLKPHEFGLQEKGFFDVEGAEDYFRLYREPSAMGSERGKLLQQARHVFASRNPNNKIIPSEKTKIPEISYVIPFRNIHRQEAIKTVVSNIKSQRFPNIHIILVEQDLTTNIDVNIFSPVNYKLAKTGANTLFNKSKAFNLGVKDVNTKFVVLHDADTLVPGFYTQKIYGILENNESCHIGKTVIYATKDASREISKSGIVDHNSNCDRVVGYFEGGSLACHTNVYWNVGGFNEDFWGYGCEDCEFYSRLSSNSKWYEDRSVDFLHLWHGRVHGWHNHHKKNKEINTVLSQLAMPKRIKKQHEQLRANGYGDKLV